MVEAEGDPEQTANVRHFGASSKKGSMHTALEQDPVAYSQKGALAYGAPYTL